jgi:hypothetical protein
MTRSSVFSVVIAFAPQIAMAKPEVVPAEPARAAESASAAASAEVLRAISAVSGLPDADRSCSTTLHGVEKRDATCTTHVVETAFSRGGRIEVRSATGYPGTTYIVVVFQPSGSKQWYAAPAYDLEDDNCGTGRCIDQQMLPGRGTTITWMKQRVWVVFHLDTIETGELHPKPEHWTRDSVIGCSLAATPRCVLQQSSVFTRARARISGDSLVFSDPSSSDAMVAWTIDFGPRS